MFLLCDLPDSTSIMYRVIKWAKVSMVARSPPQTPAFSRVSLEWSLRNSWSHRLGCTLYIQSIPVTLGSWPTYNNPGFIWGHGLFSISTSNPSTAQTYRASGWSRSQWYRLTQRWKYATRLLLGIL